MALKLSKWDVVECLKTDEDMALYLEAAMAEAGDDAAFIAKEIHGTMWLAIRRRVSASPDMQQRLR